MSSLYPLSLLKPGQRVTVRPSSAPVPLHNKVGTVLAVLPVGLQSALPVGTDGQVVLVWLPEVPDLIPFYADEVQAAPAVVLSDNPDDFVAPRLASDGVHWYEGADEQPDREPSPEQERAWDERESQARAAVFGLTEF